MARLRRVRLPRLRRVWLGIGLRRLGLRTVRPPRLLRLGRLLRLALVGLEAIRLRRLSRLRLLRLRARLRLHGLLGLVGHSVVVLIRRISRLVGHSRPLSKRPQKLRAERCWTMVFSIPLQENPSHKILPVFSIQM